MNALIRVFSVDDHAFVREGIAMAINCQPGMLTVAQASSGHEGIERFHEHKPDVISKTLSGHAVANTWWSPSSLPVWLTKEFYIQRVQPQLRTLKVREIAQAMQVSQPYAALIRSGRRRPHPRHWEALADLVGVLNG